MRALFALALLLVLGIEACSSNRVTKPVENPATTGGAPDSAGDPLAEPSALIAQKNWPKALAALKSIIDARSFRDLPLDVQYRALSTAGRVASYHGPPRLAYEYLGRAVTFPQADYGDWLERLRIAGNKLGEKADTARALTVLTAAMARSLARY